MAHGTGFLRTGFRGAAVVSVALVGGLLGVVGAVIQEAFSGGGPLAVFIGGPIIEEFMKPTGVYLLLVFFPFLLRSQLQIALLAALGGLVFAVVENLVYLNVYFPDHSTAFALFRFTVPLTMHVIASFIFGFGINQRLLASVRGEVPLLSGSRRFFAAAIVLHGVYNIIAVTVDAVFDFSAEPSA